jgi:hypothetical protein
MPRTQGIELFVRDGIDESAPFPRPAQGLRNEISQRFEITVFKTFVISRSTVRLARGGHLPLDNISINK